MTVSNFSLTTTDVRSLHSPSFVLLLHLPLDSPLLSLRTSIWSFSLRSFGGATLSRSGEALLEHHLVQLSWIRGYLGMNTTPT